MDRIRFAFASLLFTTLLAAPLFSEQGCPALNVPQVIPGSNMFSVQQEVWLGDAQAAGIEQSITILNDKALTSYLQSIVDRLAQSLPSDHIPFRVKLMDVSTASFIVGRN